MSAGTTGGLVETTPVPRHLPRGRRGCQGPSQGLCGSEPEGREATIDRTPQAAYATNPVPWQAFGSRGRRRGVAASFGGLCGVVVDAAQGSE
ncbi:hypothetical protein NDU88_007380 [Pleurodeles waltl]|uniref:Uncharacterized protein n=1 Tax=Pleurodeles waltl TaxID=8319 RepID=A0AAV7PP65_PLEWA|nr:hypothetical protein NDU88_007380 [Pleurodeles waltl]